MVNYQIELCFVSFIIFLIMLLISKPLKTFHNPLKNCNSKNVIAFFIIFTLFNVFQFWARDYYSYYVGFLQIKKFTNVLNYEYEAIYNWLADILNNNYTLWRIVIWSGASLFTYYTAKRLNVLNGNLLVLMTLLFAINNNCNVSRAVLGHTMLLFGMILSLDKKSNFTTKIIGACLFVISFYFHKSMYVNMTFAILALYPLSKRHIIVLLVAFPFLTMGVTSFSNLILSDQINMSFTEKIGGNSDRTDYYLEGQQFQFNIRGLIRYVFELIPEYLCLIYSVKRVIFDKLCKGMPNEKLYIYLTRLSFVCIYIASLFMFVDTSAWIYIRFKSMGFFPLVFVLAKLFSVEPYSNFYIKGIIIFFLIDLFFLYFYQIIVTRVIYIG